MEPLIRTIPPGGYHFPVQDGPTLEAGSFEDLIDALMKYRVTNRLPLGDPKKDIQGYYIKNFPSYASSVSAEAPPVDEDKMANSQRERMTVWSSNRYAMRTAGNTELVPQEIAEERAKICAECEFNQTYQNDCASCVDQLKRTLYLLRQGHTTSNSDQLHSCIISGQDNLTACFLPEKMLAHRKRFPNLPAHCWMTKL